MKPKISYDTVVDAAIVHRWEFSELKNPDDTVVDVDIVNFRYKRK